MHSLVHKLQSCKWLSSFPFAFLIPTTLSYIRHRLQLARCQRYFTVSCRPFITRYLGRKYRAALIPQVLCLTSVNESLWRHLTGLKPICICNNVSNNENKLQISKLHTHTHKLNRNHARDGKSHASPECTAEIPTTRKAQQSCAKIQAADTSGFPYHDPGLVITAALQNKTVCSFGSGFNTNKQQLKSRFPRLKMFWHTMGHITVTTCVHSIS